MWAFIKQITIFKDQLMNYLMLELLSSSHVVLC